MNGSLHNIAAQAHRLPGVRIPRSNLESHTISIARFFQKKFLHLALCNSVLAQTPTNNEKKFSPTRTNPHNLGLCTATMS